MADESVQRQRPLRGPWLAVFVALTLAGLFLAINHLFNLRFFVGFVLLENRYLYLLLATFFSSAFLLFPAGKGRGARVPWYDLVLFFAALVCSCYFAWHGERMVREAWEFQAPALFPPPPPFMRDGPRAPSPASASPSPTLSVTRPRASRRYWGSPCASSAISWTGSSCSGLPFTLPGRAASSPMRRWPSWGTCGEGRPRWRWWRAASSAR